MITFPWHVFVEFQALQAQRQIDELKAKVAELEHKLKDKK